MLLFSWFSVVAYQGSTDEESGITTERGITLTFLELGWSQTQDKQVASSLELGINIDWQDPSRCDEITSPQEVNQNADKTCEILWRQTSTEGG